MPQAADCHTPLATASASKEPVDLDKALFEVGDAIDTTISDIKTALAVLDLVCEAQKYENLSFEHVYWITERILEHIATLKSAGLDALHELRMRIRDSGGLVIG
jgi:hypothetical protein